MSDTNFLKTEALLAVQADDPAKAAQILEQMLPGELERLREAALNLACLIKNHWYAQEGTLRARTDHRLP
jgi:hypothetical protein